jgi:nitroreductase
VVDVIDMIYKRGSIRNYTETPVERDTIETLLRAAMAAPTAINRQPWEFIVVTDEQKIARVKKEFIFARYNAPVAIIVCGNMKLARKGLEREFWIQDCSAAVENILIAATSLGLGSVWIGVYPLETRVRLIKRIFRIPEHVIPLCLVHIGYPAEEKAPRTRYNERRVYWQEYDPQRKHRVKHKPVTGHY